MKRIKNNAIQQRIKNIGQTKVLERLVLSTNFVHREQINVPKALQFFMREPLWLI